MNNTYNKNFVSFAIAPSEKFLAVYGFYGYFVSNKGTVISTKHKNIRILQPYTTNAGYACVILTKDNKQYHFNIHRLVLSTFKPTSNKKLIVNHKDGKKANNNLDNLEWTTHKGNAKHAIEHGLFKGGINSKSYKGSIKLFSVNGEYIRTFATVDDLQKFFKSFNIRATRHYLLRVIRENRVFHGYRFIR